LIPANALPTPSPTRFRAIVPVWTDTAIGAPVLLKNSPASASSNPLLRRSSETTVFGLAASLALNTTPSPIGHSAIHILITINQRIRNALRCFRDDLM